MTEPALSLAATSSAEEAPKQVLLMSDPAFDYRYFSNIHDWADWAQLVIDEQRARGYRA